MGCNGLPPGQQRMTICASLHLTPCMGGVPFPRPARSAGRLRRPAPQAVHTPPAPSIHGQGPLFLPVFLSFFPQANAITHLGQPALLYLCPLTLGSVALVGAQRKDLQKLWSFTDTTAASGGGKKQQQEEQQQAAAGGGSKE